MIGGPGEETQGHPDTYHQLAENQAEMQTRGAKARIQRPPPRVREEGNRPRVDPEAELEVRRSCQRKAGHKERPEDQPATPREGHEQEDCQSGRAWPDAEQFSTQMEAELEGTSSRRRKKEKSPGTGAGPSQGCSHWQGQGSA